MNAFTEAREKAQQIVLPYIKQYEQYHCLSLEDARTILGPTYFDIMMADKVKNLGPIKNTIYYWNVIDYLTISLQKANKNEH